ncbi:unnamed protein product [Ceutorhynchus assimilis]|uniref:Uncharacterized protein n=1 Tax=Ceutorhynchus assimilis TaxID=467358 RepID=A0A9P0DK82_9CUCU|nr:unnamed protein product [Ceutorhynchus assimilis]
MAAKNDVGGVATYLHKESNIVDPANFCGWTPLMMAARNGHFETVKLLLQRGANCTLTNRFGLNVFQISIASGNLDMIKYLLEHFLTGGISRRIIERRLSVISLAVLYKRPEILEFLIQNDFNINWPTLDTGVTALMFAHATENAEAIATLTKHKADATAISRNKQTAQDITVIRQQLKLLIAQKKAMCREELQNQHLRKLLQVKAPTNSPKHQLVIVSPLPYLKYLTVPQQHLVRKSSDVSPISVATPNMTPIMPNMFQPQFFFPPDFSPNHRSPIPMTSLAYNSLMAKSYRAEDFLNARINNSSAGMFLSSPVTNFLHPCM